MVKNNIQFSVGTIKSILFVLTISFAVFILLPSASLSAASKNSCIACHSDPDFFVKNRKLYRYFQDYKLSRHKQEDVTCSDCHGGNPNASNKTKAHGNTIGSLKNKSAVNFKKIPVTCGGCHENIYNGFKKSKHYKLLVNNKQDSQGPSCVTCHGEMNIAALHVTTVKKVCPFCHNEKTKNNPDIPDRASKLLNRFLSMQRFNQYVSIKSDPVKSRKFLTEVDNLIRSLSVDWHTFELDKISDKTTLVLKMLKEKRDEIRKKK